MMAKKIDEREEEEDEFAEWDEKAKPLTDEELKKKVKSFVSELKKANEKVEPIEAEAVKELEKDMQTTYEQSIMNITEGLMKMPESRNQGPATYQVYMMLPKTELAEQLEEKEKNLSNPRPKKYNRNKDKLLN